MTHYQPDPEMLDCNKLRLLEEEHLLYLNMTNKEALSKLTHQEYKQWIENRGLQETCEFHKELYQELWPGQWICESCFLEATILKKGDNFMSWRDHFFKIIKINGTIEMSWDGRVAICRGCGQQIGWATTKAGKKMPFDFDEEHTAHWATCKKADKFKNRNGEERHYG